MLLAILIFIVAPIIEIAVIVLVRWPTRSVAGTPLDLLIANLDHRRLSRAARRLRGAAQGAGATRPWRLPGRELIDGLLVLAGGVMMLVPGFVSDAFGLLLLFPPTRAVVRSLVIRRFRNRIDLYVPGGTAGAVAEPGWSGTGRPRRRHRRLAAQLERAQQLGGNGAVDAASRDRRRCRRRPSRSRGTTRP